MTNLMDKLMLTCKQATFFSSIRNIRKLKLVRHIQLKLHLMACPACREFDKQSLFIDQSLLEFHKNNHLQSEENLSKEKKSQIKIAVNQRIK